LLARVSGKDSLKVIVSAQSAVLGHCEGMVVDISKVDLIDLGLGYLSNAFLFGWI
jgi:hypothetical protein